MGYKITRQRYHDDGQLAVEICSGTKLVGEDVLTTRYKELGESKYLVSPVDAVNCAIKILQKWNLDYHDELKRITFVNSDGTGSRIYFDPYDRKDISQLEKLGQDILKSMSRCGNCQRPLGATTKNIFTTEDLPNKEFCDEACAASKYRNLYGTELKVKKVAKS